MNSVASKAAQHPDYRPWFREPWVWFLIALPSAAIIGCAITIWLAITRPDYLIVDDQEYQQLKTELHGQSVTEDATGVVQEHGDG